MQLTRETDEPPPEWAGWYRPSRREPWTRLVSAPTYSACWGALLDRLASERGCDSVVPAVGIDANDSASARPQGQGDE
jgi:hypothetical protein